MELRSVSVYHNIMFGDGIIYNNGPTDEMIIIYYSEPPNKMAGES